MMREDGNSNSDSSCSATACCLPLACIKHIEHKRYADSIVFLDHTVCDFFLLCTFFSNDSCNKIKYGLIQCDVALLFPSPVLSDAPRFSALDPQIYWHDVWVAV